MDEPITAPPTITTSAETGTDPDIFIPLNDDTLCERLPF
jgi:hypothetical protein